MTKTKQAKIAAMTIEDMEHTMREMALAAARMDEVQGRMNEELARVREQYEPEIAALRSTFDVHEETALEWAEAHKAEFATKRSVALVHGVIGFRTGNPSLKTLKGVTWEAVLATLRNTMPAYIRKSEEVDKAGLLAAREEIGEENLKTVGLRVAQNDKPFAEPNIESVRQQQVPA